MACMGTIKEGEGHPRVGGDPVGGMYVNSGCPPERNEIECAGKAPGDL